MGRIRVLSQFMFENLRTEKSLMIWKISESVVCLLWGVLRSHSDPSCEIAEGRGHRHLHLSVTHGTGGCCCLWDHHDSSEPLCEVERRTTLFSIICTSHTFRIDLFGMLVFWLAPIQNWGKEVQILAFFFVIQNTSLKKGAENKEWRQGKQHHGSRNSWPTCHGGILQGNQ